MAADDASHTPPGRPAEASAPTLLQMLSLVFASADMVLEIGADAKVTFSAGAATRLLGRTAESLVGLSWRDLISAPDAELVEAALQDLNPGQRRGPFRVRLASTRGAQPAILSFFQAPQRADRISAALSLCPPGFAEVKTDASGMSSREDFEAAAANLIEDAERAGVPLHIELLEFAGLAAALADMDEDDADTARRRLTATLRSISYGGLPPAALEDDRFALLGSSALNAEALVERVSALAGAQVRLSSTKLGIAPGSRVESLRAIRYAIDRCIEDGPEAAGKSFDAALRQTVSESARFKDMVASGRFELVYQPVVDLPTRSLHHYEALTRFEGGGGPAAMIKLAEELGLVAEFDLAIVQSVVTTLREAPIEICIAANISAFSLQAEGFVDRVLQATQATPKLRPRLMLELTESHKLDDLDKANALLQRLRQAGHVICLDDFGAGAASLDYLRRLETDIVKFDGRFIQSIQTRPRDETVLRRLTELCRELKIATVAEMIETEDAAKVVAAVGIDLGQGWLFGKPVPKPVGFAAPSPVAARRKGVTETWG